MSQSLEFDTDSGHRVLRIGWWIAVLRDEDFAFKPFSSEKNTQEALENLRDEDGDPTALGMGRTVIPLKKLKGILLFPELGTLTITWGMDGSTDLRSQGDVDYQEFYEALRSKYDDQLVEIKRTAKISEVPADPQLVIAIAVGFIGVVAILIGALSRQNVPVAGRGVISFLFTLAAKVGQWIGPIPAIAFGGLLIVAGIVLVVRTLSNRPEVWKLRVNR